jgi:hypothetical protein
LSAAAILALPTLSGAPVSLAVRDEIERGLPSQDDCRVLWVAGDEQGRKADSEENS